MEHSLVHHDVEDAEEDDGHEQLQDDHDKLHHGREAPASGHVKTRIEAERSGKGLTKGTTEPGAVPKLS
jgi:hypothetical protein